MKEFNPVRSELLLVLSSLAVIFTILFRCLFFDFRANFLFGAVGDYQTTGQSNNKMMKKSEASELTRANQGTVLYNAGFICEIHNAH